MSQLKIGLTGFLFCIFVSSLCHAQGIPFAVNPPAPNARLTVCTAPAAGNPCTNTVNIYGDFALTQLISQPVFIGPTGAYTFFYASFSAPVQVQISGRPDQIVGGGGSAFGTPPASPNGVTYAACETPSGGVAGTLGYCPTTPQTTNTIYAAAAKYALPATGSFSCVPNYSNSSTTLTTDATVDTAFTSAMVGWQIFATTGPCQGGNGSTTGTVCFNGTIAAFVSAHNITLSGTPTCSCAGSQGGGVSCRAYWFPSDSAIALNSAWADATAFRGLCPTLVLPAGVFKFNAPILSTANCGPIGALATGTAYNGPSVQGQSMSGTILVADPNFNAATCSPGCVFALASGVVQSLSLRDFTITGGGNATVTNGSAACKISSQTGWPSTAENLLLDYWGYNTAGFFGICWNGGGQGQSYIKNVNVYNGGYQCAKLGNNVTVENLMCFTPAGSQISLAQNGTILTKGSSFNGGNAGGYAMTVSGRATSCAAGGAQWISKGDQFTSIQNNGTLLDDQTCPVRLDGDYLVSNHLINIQVGDNTVPTAGTVFMRDSIAISNSPGTANIGGTQAGSFFYDEGGNTLTGPNTLTNVTWIADGHQLKGNCTGVATANTTLGLYGTGANVTVGTCTSAAIGLGVPTVGAHTLQNLSVTATAAGTNASSGVMTVLKNGVATTITCTIGTGTSCTDGTHAVAIVDGDRISIQFTTQAAETLAGVSASIGWF